MPNPSNVRRQKGLFVSTLHQFLLVDAIRYFVAYIRYLYFVLIRRALKTYDLSAGQVSAVSANTIIHNLKGLRDLAVNRSLLLVRPLSVIETLDTNAKILTIGPRTEGEILNLMAYGFTLENIVGLDLISYSPWIQLGDMHQMVFDSDTFDAVILGWVVSYSADPTAMAREIIRVTKPGGVVAVGLEYNPLSVQQIAEELGYTPGHTERLQTCDEVLALFKPHVDNIYFYHPVVPARKDKVGALCVIFSVKK